MTGSPQSDPELMQRAAELHERDFGVPSTLHASAPAQWNFIGENTDHMGGAIVNALCSLRLALVASPREDESIVVRSYRTLNDELVPIPPQLVSAETLDEATESAASSPAGQLGAVKWMLINRQLLSRDTPGFDVTLLSEIPPKAGLGENVALQSAWALALAQLTEQKADAPLRAHLAEYCAMSSRQSGSAPVQFSRFATALRGTGNAFTLVDHLDGGVTSAPFLGDHQAVLIMAPNPGQETDRSGDDVTQLLEREEFVSAAEKAFGVDELSRLPDASIRVLDWLKAVRNRDPESSFPNEAEAGKWLRFYDSEISRTRRAATALRARKSIEALEQVSESSQAMQDEYLSMSASRQALLTLCTSRGAIAARCAAAGLSHAVIAYVEKRHALNFLADLREDQLLAMELHPGEVAS